MAATIDPTEFVKKYAPWSVSKADTAKQCPHKFWFNYVVKERNKAPVKFDAVKGRAGHKALEYALSGRPVGKCVRFAAEEFELTTSETEELSLLQPAMENFMRKFNHYCQKNGAKEILVEKELAVDFEGNKTRYWGTDCFIRGMADVIVMFKGKPYALILDHKTGKVRDMKYYANQFAIYRMMLKAHYPHLQKIMVGVNWVQGDSIELGKFIEVPDLAPLVSDVISFCNESTNGVDNFEETRRSGLCGWCDFRYLCPAYPESDANGDEDKKEEGNIAGTA
jgi:hypothetical protein